jgi:hypothetical protein
MAEWGNRDACGPSANFRSAAGRASTLNWPAVQHVLLDKQPLYFPPRLESLYALVKS